MSAYRLTSDLGRERKLVRFVPRLDIRQAQLWYFRRWLVPRRRVSIGKSVPLKSSPLLVPPRVVKSKSGILVEEAPSEATLIHVKLDPDERLSMLIVGSIKASV